MLETLERGRQRTASTESTLKPRNCTCCEGTREDLGRLITKPRAWSQVRTQVICERGRQKSKLKSRTLSRYTMHRTLWAQKKAMIGFSNLVKHQGAELRPKGRQVNCFRFDDRSEFPHLLAYQEDVAD